MIDLCDITQVKAWLGIVSSDPHFNDDDDLLNRLITATSVEFANEIRRPDFAPTVTYIDRIVGNGACDLYLKHYPIISIDSVTISGDTQTESSDGIESGWFFDDTQQPEDCQKITFIGSVWPLSYSTVPNIVINYHAGYNSAAIPTDVTQAVIEWIGWKRGYSQLQGQNQATVSWMQLGEYQQSITAGASTLKASSVVMPDSVRQVVERYTRSSL